MRLVSQAHTVSRVNFS